MSQPSQEELKFDYVVDLMSQFFVHENKAIKMAGNGAKFIDVHEEQIKAANIMNALIEEDLLDEVEKIYPWAKEIMDEYLQIHNEIQNGVRI